MNKSQRVAALTVLRDAIDAELENARHHLHQEMLSLQEQFQVKSVEVSINDTAVASATLTERETAYVISSKEFTAWVEEYYPYAIETIVRVNPDWQKDFLSKVQPFIEQEFVGNNAVQPDAVDETTGLFVDGVKFTPVKKILTVRFKKEGRERVAEMFRTGQATLEQLMSDTPEITK